jgi:hypothetical protein
VTGKPDAGIRVTFGDRTYDVGEWVWSGTYDHSSLDRSHDVALLHLTAPVDGIDPMPLSYDVPPSSEWFTIIGFGSVSGDSHSSTRTKHRASAWVSMRSDAWFEARGGSQASTCYGDSGGPAIDSAGRVFGVSSLVNSGCAGIFWYSAPSSKTR